MYGKAHPTDTKQKFVGLELQSCWESPEERDVVTPSYYVAHAQKKEFSLDSGLGIFKACSIMYLLLCLITS